jgi:hypothetical protein
MKETELAFRPAITHLLVSALSSFVQAATSATTMSRPHAQQATTHQKETSTVVFVLKDGRVQQQLLTTLFKLIVQPREACTALLLV